MARTHVVDNLFPKTTEPHHPWATATPLQILRDILATRDSYRKGHNMTTEDTPITPPFTTRGFHIETPQQVDDILKAELLLGKAQRDLESANQRNALSLTPEALRDRLDALDRAITEDRAKHKNLTQHVEDVDSALVAQRERVWQVEQQLAETPWATPEKLNERIDLTNKRVEKLEELIAQDPDTLLNEGAVTFAPALTPPFPNSMFVHTPIDTRSPAAITSDVFHPTNLTSDRVASADQDTIGHYVRTGGKVPPGGPDWSESPSSAETTRPEPSTSPQRALQALQQALTLLARADWTSTPQNGAQRRSERIELGKLVFTLQSEQRRSLLRSPAQPDHMGQDVDENTSIAETMVDRIMKPAKARDGGDRSEEY